MISKLDRLQGRDIYENTALAKLNEVIDAVNEIMTWRFETDEDSDWYDGQIRLENVQPVAETRPENVQDKFAQYRDWAGKLCRFWNKDKDRAIYDILEEVIANWSYQFRTKSDCVFDHCEPVKPDDDIIYKGE